MIISFTLQQDSSLLGILWDTYCIWELHEGRTNTFQFGVCTKHFTLYTSWDIEHLPWSLLRSSLLQQDCHYCFRLQFFHFSQMLADLVTLWMMLPVRWNRIHFSAFMIPLWQMHWGLLHCVHCAESYCHLPGISQTWRWQGTAQQILSLSYITECTLEFNLSWNRNFRPHTAESVFKAAMWWWKIKQVSRTWSNSFLTVAVIIVLDIIS